MKFPGLHTIHKTSYATISPTRAELSQAGRVILIAGGTAGIGFAIAKAFIAASAHKVIVLGRRSDVLASAVAELTLEVDAMETSTNIEGHICDISDLESTRSLWETLREQGTVVDVFVLNACAPGAVIELLEIGRDNIWQDYNTNVRAWLDFVERLYKQEEHRADRRKVVLGLSTLAAFLWRIVKDRPTYTLSKNAGTALLQQLARAVEPQDMQISIFHPGTIFTESMRNLGGKI